MKVLAKQIKTRSGYPNWREMRKEVERTIDRPVKPELLDYFTRITDLWKSDVGFSARKQVTAREISVYAFPTGADKKIWSYVSDGTPPRTITAKRAPYLKFRLGYKPKTWRGYRYRGPGRADGEWRQVKQVKRHSITAREIEKHIMRFYMPKFRRHMENALRRGMRRL